MMRPRFLPEVLADCDEEFSITASCTGAGGGTTDSFFVVEGIMI